MSVVSRKKLLYVVASSSLLRVSGDFLPSWLVALGAKLDPDPLAISDVRFCVT